MDNYVCGRCGKEFSEESKFDRHIKRVRPCKKKPVETMKFIDLCCGIGGFHYALKNMGFECVLASDINKDCRENYEMNHGIKPEGDLSLIPLEKIPEFDVLCAGFPCQPFSKAGEQGGFSDSRGNVFFEICKIVEKRSPKYMILENVKNLATHDKGNTWSVIRRQIDVLGYWTYDKPIILNTLFFGIPQSRERVVILCKRKDLGELKALPCISKKDCKPTSLESIIESGVVDEKYWLSEKMKVVESVWGEFIEMCWDKGIKIPKFPIWTEWWDNENAQYSGEEERESAIQFYQKYKNWIDKNREFYQKNKTHLSRWLVKARDQELWKGAVRKMEWQVKSETRVGIKDLLWSPRGSGIRIKDVDYSPTLVAMASMIPIYGPKSRHLTLRECARLQSFPEEYIYSRDKTAYTQFGNAVNVKMIERSARFLINGEELLELGE